jgi:hypothetical protein
VADRARRARHVHLRGEHVHRARRAPRPRRGGGARGPGASAARRAGVHAPTRPGPPARLRLRVARPPRRRRRRSVP